MNWQRRGLAVAVGLMCSFAQVGWAQDLEPNDTCAVAQDAGTFTPGTSLNCTLDRPDFPRDTDFYRFTGTAGDRVVVDLTGPIENPDRLSDPFLGFFDSNCNLVDFNDDFMSLNSHLEFAIPADGTFVLGVTSCC